MVSHQNSSTVDTLDIGADMCAGMRLDMCADMRVQTCVGMKHVQAWVQTYAQMWTRWRHEGMPDGGCPPRTPHSAPSAQRRECRPLSHGYMPGCGLTTSIASLVGPAQSGPPGGSGYRLASPRVDGSVGTADARVARACVCHCVCASARETIPRSVAHSGVAAGDAPLPYRACSDRGPSGLRGEWGHLTVL